MKLNLKNKYKLLLLYFDKKESVEIQEGNKVYIVYNRYLTFWYPDGIHKERGVNFYL